MANKCCVCLNINVGVILIGFGSVILFLTLSVTSGVLLVLEEEVRSSLIANKIHLVQSVGGVEFNVISVYAVLVTTFVVSVLATMFSVLLLIGLAKTHPGLLLSYFGFGIMFNIIMFLGCLLLTIQCYWYISLPLLLATLVYIHYLIVVHSAYEMMQRGKLINRHGDMQEELLS